MGFGALWFSYARVLIDFCVPDNRQLGMPAEAENEFPGR